MARELLEGVTAFRVVASRQTVGPGHLTNVDVTPGICCDAVRRNEVARGAAIGAAPTKQHVSGQIEHENAAGEDVVRLRPPEVYRAGRRPPRRDVDQPLSV